MNFLFKLYKFSLPETVCRILHRLRIISVKHTFQIFIKELEHHKPQSIVEMDGLSIILRELFEQELEKLEYSAGMHSIETLREHFAYGSRFFAAFCENKVIALGELNTQIAQLTYIRMSEVRLPQNFVYLNSGFVAPEYRSQGIGTALTNYIQGIAKIEGHRMALLVTLPENFGAICWHYANGFQKWGEITYLRWNGRDLWWKHLTKAGRRYAHILDQAETRQQTQAVLEKVS